MKEQQHASCFGAVVFIVYVNFDRCPNLAVKEAEDDENIEEEDVLVKTKKASRVKRKKQTQCKLTWVGEPVQVLDASRLMSLGGVCHE